MCYNKVINLTVNLSSCDFILHFIISWMLKLFKFKVQLKFIMLWHFYYKKGQLSIVGQKC